MFLYETGEKICKGDKILYSGSPGKVIFVAGPETMDSEEEWYAKSFPPGGFMIEAENVGSVFLQEGPFEDLILVSRSEPV